MLAFNFHPFPQLATASLNLRPVTLNDADAIYKLRTDAEIMKYLDRPMPASVKEIEDWINLINNAQQKNESIIWAITQKNNDDLIGTISYWRLVPEHHRAEIGYTLSTTHQGRGIMNEALKEVINYGFVNMKLHSIEANTNPANLASRGLLEKNDFKLEGYFKENYYYDGKFLDSAIYSLITPLK